MSDGWRWSGGRPAGGRGIWPRSASRALSHRLSTEQARRHRRQRCRARPSARCGRRCMQHRLLTPLPKRLLIFHHPRAHTPPSHMRPAASYVAACVLALPALAAAFRPEVLLAQPGIAAAPSTARRAASRITLLLDPSLAADASAALVPAAASPGLAPWDAHTLSTLWPDMIHTTIYATVGLMGAYVTQVTPCQRAFPLCSVAHLLRPPSACRAAGRGGLRPADGRRLRRPARAHAPAAPAAALRV